MILILFGAPGVGKGTQSSLLVERLGMEQISTGDLFRKAISNKTLLGLEAKSYMDKGNLVPDTITNKLVQERILSSKKPIVLDGYPRNLAQGQALEDFLSKVNLKIDKVISLDVENEVLIQRLSGRRSCSSCKEIYHIQSKKPVSEGICDKCGGQLVQRNDDKLEVIKDRLKIYSSQTLPLKEFYSHKGILKHVNGDRNLELVFSDLRSIIEGN